MTGHSYGDRTIYPGPDAADALGLVRPGECLVSLPMSAVDDLLIQARAMLPRRPSPAEAFHAQQNGLLVVDIRGDEQRRADGLIPGAIVLPQLAGVALRSLFPVAASRHH